VAQRAKKSRLADVIAAGKHGQVAVQQDRLGLAVALEPAYGHRRQSHNPTLASTHLLRNRATPLARLVLASATSVGMRGFGQAALLA